MRDRHEVSAVRELGVASQITAHRHDVRGDGACLERGLERRRVLGASPRRERVVEQIGVREPAGRRGEARIGPEVVPRHHVAERTPGLVAGDRDRDPAVVADDRIHAVRRVIGIAIPRATHDAAVDRVVEERRRQEVERRFGLREIDVLPLARATAMVERRQDGDGDETRGDVVGVGAERAGGRAIGPPPQVREARDRGGQIAVAGEGLERPRLAHETGGEHHQVGLPRREGGPVEAPARHRPGRERLRHDVGPRHQVEDHPTARVAGRVERQHALADVQVLEAAGVLGTELAAAIGCQRAGGVDATRGLDAHDGGAVVGEDPGRGRAGHDPHEVEHVHVAEGAGHQIAPSAAKRASAASSRPSSPW